MCKREWQALNDSKYFVYSYIKIPPFLAVIKNGGIIMQSILCMGKDDLSG